MPALPYAFDTSATPRLIVHGVFALAAILAIGLAYSLMVSRHLVAAAVLGVCAAIALLFGLRIAKNLTATIGVITASRVDVRPARALGIRLAGPSGSFPIRAFRAVRYEDIVADVEIIGSSGRVVLTGADAPDVLIARTGDEGRQLARALAAELKLPYDERVKAN